MAITLTTPIAIGKTATKYTVAFTRVDFAAQSVTVSVSLSDAQDNVLSTEQILLTFADVGITAGMISTINSALIAKLTAMAKIN